MKQAPIPKNEQERLNSLYNLGLLDTPREKRFDLITLVATRIFNVPISTLTLVDSKREWFKSCQGLSQSEGERAISFCGHALLSKKILVVPDTKKDIRFMDNPMVIGKPYLRFYAGVPVMSVDGQRVGVLCVKDIKPRKFSKNDGEILKGLALWAEIEVNSHNLDFALKQERKNQLELKLQAQKLKLADKIKDNTKKAMLNVMEDFVSARTIIETEKAKDEAILASIGEGLIAVDNNRKVIIVNKVAEEMLGFKSNKVVGQDLTKFRLEDENGNLVPLNKRPTYLALSTGKQIEVTYFFVRKDKTRLPITIIANPIKLKGKIVGLVEIIRDVTKDLAIDKAKSEFVSLASHQLRTPLGIIKWYLEALEDEDYLKRAPVVVKKYFSEIFKSNERVLSLVRDLLSVSRIDQGRVKNEPKMVNIIQIITDIVEQMKIIAHKKGITLTLNTKDQKIPRINIDVLRFHEVLENLINNGIEYTKSGGTVHLTVNKVDSVLLINVKDTGIGISVADQKRLFTKFFRSERAIGHNSEGSGLGLYVVKSYVEGWGGKIFVQSVEGRGSTFTINLPIKIGGEKNEKR